VARNRAARPEARPLRLFVAVDVPPDVRSAVDAAASPLRDELPGARWVPPENWHVTVKFLGRTWPRLLDWVTASLRAVADRTAPFETSARDFGAFPSARRARVLWVGLDDPSGGAANVAGAVDAALAREFEPERRAFSAHLTIARIDPPARLGGDLPPVATRAWGVDRLILYRSHLRRPAPVYEPVDSFPLRGAG
jgi:2'-5' RNA ligase